MLHTAQPLQQHADNVKGFSKLCRSTQPRVWKVEEVELPEVTVLYTEQVACATDKITCIVAIAA